MFRDVTNKITVLAKDTLEKINKQKENGDWKESDSAFLTQKITDFEYDIKGGKVHFSNSVGLDKRIIIDSAFQNDLMAELHEMKSYQEAKEATLAIRSSPDGRSDLLLIEFLNRVVEENLGKVPTLEDLNPVIHTFLNDLTDGPIEWDISVFLSGVLVENTPVKLTPKISIRQLSKDDVERSMTKEPFYLFGTPYFLESTAVLSINTIEKLQPWVYPDISRFVLLLLLYRRGSINVLRYNWKGNTLDRHYESFGMGPFQTWFPNEKYVIKNSDSKNIRLFVDTLKEKLPVDKNGQILTDNYIGISITRYQDAIIKNEDPVNRISYAVMGLEALFLKASENGELAFRLAQRVSKIMSEVSDENVFRINDKITQAYDIRSRFVHGSVQDHQNTDHKAILDEILDFLRKSIIFFILLSKEKEKEQVINMIDNAVLDASALRKIRDTIKLFIEVCN